MSTALIGRDVSDVVLRYRPSLPVFAINAGAMADTARRFRRDVCAGGADLDVLYAVKCCPDREALKALAAGGIRRFDVASLAEVEAVRSVMPDAVCDFMHPVKPEHDIRSARHLGVTTFALDCDAELDKILEATGGGQGCTLTVRVAVTPGKAVYDLSGKFGATPDEAAALLRRIRSLGIGAGLTFHVGSQCLDPTAFADAVRLCGSIAALAGTTLDILDVGGGFPARYSGLEPEISVYGHAIAQAVRAVRPAIGVACRLQCEPGRALVAEGASAAVRVDLRKGNVLFVNDGIYGLLSDLKLLPAMHPIRRIGSNGGNMEDGDTETAMTDFVLAGPTCDSADLMPGPYRAVVDVRAGDWLEIGFMGAYSVGLATPFNGFGEYIRAMVGAASDRLIEDNVLIAA